jgi:hypothetical protein
MQSYFAVSGIYAPALPVPEARKYTPGHQQMSHCSNKMRESTDRRAYLHSTVCQLDGISNVYLVCFKVNSFLLHFPLSRAQIENGMEQVRISAQTLLTPEESVGYILAAHPIAAHIARHLLWKNPSSPVRSGHNSLPAVTAPI